MAEHKLNKEKNDKIVEAIEVNGDLIINELAALGARMGLVANGEITGEQLRGHSEDDVLKASATVALSAVAAAIKYNPSIGEKLNHMVNATMQAIDGAINDGILDEEEE